MDTLCPLTLTAFDLLHLVGRINHGKWRLDLVARVGNESLLFAVALDHRSNHGARGHRHDCEHCQPSNAADGNTRAQKRMEARKFARAVNEHIGRLVTLNGSSIAVVPGKSRGPALGIELGSHTRGTLGAHRSNTRRVDIRHNAIGKRHGKVARVERRLCRHTLEMLAGIARLAHTRTFHVTGIGLRLIRPINTVLARQDIVQTSVGHLADMRVVDDVDARDNEREHRRDGTHGNQDKLAAQATAQRIGRVRLPRPARSGVGSRGHALPPRSHAHSCPLSSTTSSE